MEQTTVQKDGKYVIQTCKMEYLNGKKWNLLEKWRGHLGQQRNFFVRFLHESIDNI